MAPLREIKALATGKLFRKAPPMRTIISPSRAAGETRSAYVEEFLWVVFFSANSVLDNCTNTKTPRWGSPLLLRWKSSVMWIVMMGMYRMPTPSDVVTWIVSGGGRW